MRSDETKTGASRTWSRAALGAMTAGVIVVDPAGRVVLANPGAGRILGRDPAALMGAPLRECLGSLEVLHELAESDRGQLQIRRPDGTRATVGYSLSELGGSYESEIHHVLLFQDITSTIELKAERDRLLQLAAVGDVLPSLLHELRNPIAGVTTSLEVLIEDMEDGETRSTLHALLGELRRVQLTLQGIGTVGRDLAGDGHHAIDQALRDVCRVMEAGAREAGIQLRAHIPDLPLLPLDAAVLRGVLFNLLNNAIAATHGQGTIDVYVSQERAELLLEVRDTGTGMTPEVRARCTDLFFTTKRRGSGIGLALTKRTVESVGGALEIASELGRGTSVRLRIPIDRAASTPALRAARPTR